MIALALAAQVALQPAIAQKTPPPSADCRAALEAYIAKDRQQHGGRQPLRAYRCANGKVEVADLPLGRPNAESSRMPNAYKVPEKCKDRPTQVVDRFGRPVPIQLGALPKGALYYAIDTRIDGCPVLTVVYGDAARDDPNPPPSAYRMQPLTPKPKR